MASAVDSRRIIKNAPYRARFLIINATGLNPITGGLTGLDAEVSKDAGGFVNAAATETEDATSGFGYVDLSATEMTADLIEFQVKATNSGAVTYIRDLYPEEAMDSGVAQTGTTLSVTLRAAASAVDDFYNNATIEIVRGTGAGQCRIIRKYVGSTQVATVDLAFATAPDVTSVYVIKASALNIRGTEADSGTAQGGGASSIVLASTASSTNDLYNGSSVSIIRGTGAGQTRVISDYVGSSRTASVDVDFVTNPDSTSVYIVYPTAQSLRSSTLLSSVNVTSISDSTVAAVALAALYKGGLLSGTIDDVSVSANEFNLSSGFNASDNVLNGMLLIVTTGSAAGMCEKILDYVGSTRTVTLRTSLAITPANGDSVVVLGRIV